MDFTLLLPDHALRAYQFPALRGTIHAVFTRLGGDSPSPWQSLNLGSGVGDQPDRVATNFARACSVLGINADQTATCKQVHGNTVLEVKQNSGGQSIGEADALISRIPGVVLTLRFADCTPLLVFDPLTPAVGLGHAGWRGTMQNVTGSLVQAMGEAFGSKPAELRLVIGPAIGSCCYPVGDDVYRAAQSAFCNPTDLFTYHHHHLHFDMWLANARQAREAGVKQVIVSGLCTACHTDEFFSHRAEHGKTGRFGAFLGLPEQRK